MEKFRTRVLFLCLSAFVIAFSVSACAETVEEKKAAVNYDEILPVSEEARTVDETSAGTQPAQAVVPSTQVAPTGASEREPVPSSPSGEAIVSQTVPVAPSVSSPKTAVPQASEAVQPLPAAPKSTSRDMPEDEVFTTSNPSGLVEVSGYKYPVFLFAPKDYKTDRTYAMIMIAPAESAKAEQQIEYLTGLAQRKSIFVLAPYVLWPKAGDTPYKLDDWLLTVKRDVVERFPINKKRVYLVGKDLGGHYAAYMATKYPKEFAAAALLGEAWAGPFSELIDPRTDAEDQIPFYVALKTSGNARERNQSWFDDLQKKGYPIHLVDYKSDEDLNELEFKKDVFNWMETTGQNWEASVAQGQQTWKGKFKKGVRDFFAV
jgi:pimeloyl-ACP methyl ester carboxylesterase